MSDGFDKEAEREKLREKFAEDEKKREHTQRMSELLLKGATMTNRHCEECGDPIFRHDGREFCPTCGNEVGGGAGDGSAAADATPADAAAENGADAAAANGTAGPEATDADAVAPRANEDHRSESSPSAAPQSQGAAQESGASRGSASQGSEPRRSGPQPDASRGSTQPRSAADAEGIGAARATLTRTLNKFARAAEETDDPRRARDHLEAAREAAETLAALDR